MLIIRTALGFPVTLRRCPLALRGFALCLSRSTSGLQASGSALLLDVVRGLVATRSASFDAERSEKADADDAGTGRTDNGEPVARVGEPHEQKRGNHDRRRQRKDDPPEDS